MIRDVMLRYIGAKALLLQEIEALLNKHINGTEESFLDLFAGTNIVGRHFKKDYRIITNDLLYFSYCHSKAVIENNLPLLFKGLGFDPFVYLNDKNNVQQYRGDLYYTKNYTPLGEAMYFSEDNGRRLDFIRNTIDEWFSEKRLEEHEYFYLLACLIAAVPPVSNTTGTYGAFLKHWDNRALKPLQLNPLAVLNNNRANQAYNQDANQLVKELSADIVYIDPPYNNRQYAANYHVLENIALNTKPRLKGVTRLFDWQSKRSNYSTSNGALAAMTNLIDNIEATHIIISYNDEGIINHEDMLNLLKERAIDKRIDVVKIPYRKYQSKISSKKADLNEYLFYIKKKELQQNKQFFLRSPTHEASTWTPKRNAYIKSPLNYIGGKYRLLSQIIPLFPKHIDTFVDLFSGGANVGINVPAKKHIFNDMNTKVNEMFIFFASQDTERCIAAIKNNIEKYDLSKTNEEGFLKLREAYNAQPNPLDLYTLVSYSYNYQLRFNNEMKFNNPFGRNRSSFSQNMENNLRAFNNKLQTLDYQFTSDYFDNADLTFLDSNDFVYLDPPYLITTGNYNDGNRGFKNWGDEEERKLLKLLDYLNAKGVRYALSNVISHKGKENYLLKEYLNNTNTTVHQINSSYGNASYNTKKETSKEVLVTNYCPTSFELLN